MVINFLLHDFEQFSNLKAIIWKEKKYSYSWLLERINYWKNEFKVAQDLGFELIEWIVDSKNNPIFDNDGIHEILKLSEKHEVKINSLCGDYFMDNFLFKDSEEMIRKNVDILKHISNHNSHRPKLVVGFAAETNELRKNSLKKLSDKNCDWIIANDVSNSEIGFNSDFNKVSIFYKNKDEEIIPKMKKSDLAKEIVNRIVSELN